MQSYWYLNYVVHILTTVLCRVNFWTMLIEVCQFCDKKEVTMLSLVRMIDSLCCCNAEYCLLSPV
jgi:hypothetical protein